MCLGKIWFDGESLVAACNGLIEQSLVLQDNTQIVMGLGVIWLDSQGLVLTGHRLINLP